MREMEHIETTHKHSRKYTKRFRYFERVYGDIRYPYRVTRMWWKPAMFLGNVLRRFVKTSGGQYQWFIRKHLTFD